MQSEISDFLDQGFLALRQITTPEEVGLIRGLYDQLFQLRQGWRTGDLFDFAGADEPGSVAVLPQLLNPSHYEPRLHDTLFRANAHAIARQLLGPAVELVFEHAIMKPAHIGGTTTWHQDEAFYPRYNDYGASITIWMPLQPVDLENGCMEFIPGSHHGPLLRHHSINYDPRIPGLEAEGADIDPGLARACPLPAGGATIHHSRTLHYAGPNRSDGPRRAYALGFAVRSRALRLQQEHPWNQEKSTASARRAHDSLGNFQRCAVKLKRAAKAALGRS